MVFLTYNDAPSGIYKSQVIDVVKYLNTIQPGAKVRLVALISVRDFGKNRSKLTSALPGSIIIPMFPKADFWKLNFFILFLLFLFIPSKKVMARGPFAACLALWLKKSGLVKKVIFDGRGAYDAEINEYNVIPNEKVKREMPLVENAVIQNSDYRLAVSNALVRHWREKYNFTKQEYVVIPCTLSAAFEFEFPAEAELAEQRRNLGYKETDIVFVYSGSAAGWQSFNLIDGFICELMDKNADVKLLVLSSHFDEQYEVTNRHRARVKVNWVEPNEVKNYLLAGDYGILYRERSVTNKVASPVKYAEYLACGLKVVISEELGDYTAFSKEMDLTYNDCSRVSYDTKKRIHGLAMEHFRKENYRKEYLSLLDF